MSNRTYSQAFNDGKAAPCFNYIFDPTIITTGGLGVTTGAFRPFVVTDLYASATNVSNSSVSNINGLAITGNLNRKMWSVKNLATGLSPLYVKYGTGASIQSFNIILGANNDPTGMNGGLYIDDKPKWLGDVSVSGQNTNFMSWELI